MKINYIKLLASIVICEMAGIVGSFFTVPSIKGWYATLSRPALNPPNWIFGPVWTTLFLLMGIALYLVWSKRKIPAIFWAQLILNILWSVIFFGWHNLGAAFFELILLWLAILYTIISFYRISKPAAYLLVPYILWVTFAGFLNYSLWILN
ncbi:MAG: TspO/MBR family protein [Candidatus Buchananbacteria bacterium]